MKKSAGILVFRKIKTLEVFLIHPGGPFWQNKDLNSWSIPKGEVEKETNLLETALREFKEETGINLKEDKEKIFYLGKCQSSNKVLYVFALNKNLGEIKIKSKFIKIEWPVGSNKKIKITEVDKGEYFDLKTAKEKLVNYQKVIIDKLKNKLQN